MLLNKPVVFGRADAKKFDHAQPTKTLYKGLKQTDVAEHNSKYANFDWVKKLFRHAK